MMQHFIWATWRGVIVGIPLRWYVMTAMLWVMLMVIDLITGVAEPLLETGARDELKTVISLIDTLPSAQDVSAPRLRADRERIH